MLAHLSLKSATEIGIVRLLNIVFSFRLFFADEVTADLTAAREQACTAQLRVTFLEDTTGELRTETERRERELATYISHLESKNQVVNKLLEILEERTQSLQADLDR